ncbi:hypothetical protein FRC07_000347 [Ceratobasidium sp. 392]|nr:hypothetical protein FRC07_000347 [Ceratobasidium sp. 392]
MTAPPARPHLGFRPSSHFSIITAAQANADWAEDDAWDSGSDDDKPLAPPRKSTAHTSRPSTPSRNGTLNLLPTTITGGPSPISTAPSPLNRPNPPPQGTNVLSAPIPFKQPSGPTPLNMIRAASNNLRKPPAELNPSIGSGTPNSTSSNAELSFSYTHVHAPSPSSYPPSNPVHMEPETASIGEGATTTATTTDDEGRGSVEVSSPPGAKGRGWMFIKGHKGGKEKEADEPEREGYRRWEMSASGSVDFGGIMPDAPDSEESDGEAMVVGDIDVDVGDSSRGRDKELGRGRLEFARAQASGSEDEKGKGERVSSIREVVEEEEDEEETPKEKEGIEAIREDADTIVAGKFHYFSVDLTH